MSLKKKKEDLPESRGSLEENKALLGLNHSVPKSCLHLGWGAPTFSTAPLLSAPTPAQAAGKSLSLRLPPEAQSGPGKGRRPPVV